MSLGKQERFGVIILAAVTLLITACGLLMRYCVPHAKPLPEKTVIYKTATVTDTVYTVYRERKRSGKNEGKADRKAKKSKSNGRKSRKEKNTPSAVPVRDFLKDTIPASR